MIGWNGLANFQSNISYIGFNETIYAQISQNINIIIFYFYMIKNVYINFQKNQCLIKFIKI